MSEILFGEIDWNSGDTFGSDKAKFLFMKLEQGTSTVRVMGNPHQFHTHWIVLPDGSKRKINSPVASPDLLKQLEELDFKRKPRWLVKVLDRSDNTFKLLEIGSQIYNGIRALFNNPKWGKVTEYDIDIIRAKPGTNPLYAVQPNPKEKLSNEYRDAFLEFNDAVNLDALTKPAEPSEVRKILQAFSQSEAVSMDTTESTEDESFGFDFK